MIAIISSNTESEDMTVRENVCTVCLMSVVCVSAQHPVFILPDCAAECVCALPVWRRQCHLVSGSGVMVRHRD